MCSSAQILQKDFSILCSFLTPQWPLPCSSVQVHVQAQHWPCRHSTGLAAAACPTCFASFGSTLSMHIFLCPDASTSISHSSVQQPLRLSLHAPVAAHVCIILPPPVAETLLCPVAAALCRDAMGPCCKSPIDCLAYRRLVVGNCSSLSLALWPLQQRPALKVSMCKPPKFLEQRFGMTLQHRIKIIKAPQCPAGH